MYYHRQLENKIIDLSHEYACITLYGARQTGKSTMIRNLFDKYEYITLDSGKERELATSNPELFLQAHSTPLIIDEIQKAPGLMEEIKIRIDEEKFRCTSTGENLQLMYILTGSNTHEIHQKASETLAGRTAIIEVNSFSECEKTKTKGSAFVPDIEVLKEKEIKAEPFVFVFSQQRIFF